MPGKRRATLLICDNPTGPVLADWSRRAMGLVIKDGEHGPLTLEATIRMSRREAFRWFSYQKIAHIEVTFGGKDKQWAGRLEDVAIVEEGIRITAFGYWRALFDLPDTAMWSTSSVTNWKPVLSTQWGAAVKDRYVIDSQNRLFISPKKGQSFSNAVTGAIAYGVPDASSRQCVQLRFTYNLTFPAAGWQARALATDDFVSFSVLWTLNSAAGTQTGSQTLTFTNKRYVVFDLYYNNAVAAASTYEDGAAYLSISPVRVLSTTNSSLDAREILLALHSITRGTNPDQLSATTSLIGASGLDIPELSYEDEYPAVIAARLAKLRLWDIGVDAERRLYYRARGSAARDFYVSLADLQLERTLDNLANSVYGVYQAADGSTLRTATSTDTVSTSRRNLTRRVAIEAQTTSSTEAIAQRDAVLSDQKDPRPRARVKIRRLYTKQGARVPLHDLRAGDRLTIQDLPPSMTSSTIDRIRTFYVKERQYSFDDDNLGVTPEEPIPELERMLQR